MNELIHSEPTRAGGKCCGTCCWHWYDGVAGGWICANPDSEYYTDRTGCKDHCGDWGLPSNRTRGNK